MVEKRLDRIENQIEEINKMLHTFGNKLFNGYGEQICNIEKMIIPLASKTEKLDSIQIACLATRHAEKEMIIRFEKKVQIYLGILGILASSPLIIKLIWG